VFLINENMKHVGPATNAAVLRECLLGSLGDINKNVVFLETIRADIGRRKLGHRGKIRKLEAEGKLCGVDIRGNFG
jgi:hypothetical protein